MNAMNTQKMKTQQAIEKIVRIHPFGSQHHHQCAWCLRLTHADNRPHGRPLPKLAEYSHGICAQCKADLLAHRGIVPVRVVILDPAAMATGPSAA